jgi:hypothetical protein
VFSGEQGAHVCSHLVSSNYRAGYRRRVLERWGHSNVQCSSSCNALAGRGTRDTLCVIWELWA